MPRFVLATKNNLIESRVGYQFYQIILFRTKKSARRAKKKYMNDVNIYQLKKVK